ncbi:hypothetical protein [Azospirillum soli]|uniref:hypothetical protein n=1 Tax=Azospirillum soli TaxID=1304799 RepID=UPI001AE1AA1E|nr:hypothetical protein [Azospirillum soli]MBP2316569.1 hypothetical protein [Azospirillum soli]
MERAPFRLGMVVIGRGRTVHRRLFPEKAGADPRPDSCLQGVPGHAWGRVAAPCGNLPLDGNRLSGMRPLLLDRAEGKAEGLASFRSGPGRRVSRTMRILITIPHYCGPPKPDATVRYGSTHGDQADRVTALRDAIIACHRHFGPQGMMHSQGAKRIVRRSNTGFVTGIDVVVVTTGGRHLLDALDLPAGFFEHQPVDAAPMMLGFACHKVLAERLGRYDYYGYIEDDLVIEDASFFDKLSIFNKVHGESSVLLPNRYETALVSNYRKLYIDRAMLEHLPIQSVEGDDRRIIQGPFLNRTLVLERPSNPHSGCFFLDERQMRIWRSRPFFLDRDTSFVGPLESAATLGILKTFKIFKPHESCASFLEIRHACNRYLEQEVKTIADG